MLVSLFLTIFPCIGQDTGEVISPIEYREHYVSEVPHSGGIRIGMMTSYKSDPIDPSFFSVIIPESNQKYLCCDISSRDGKYEANLKYDISFLKPGFHKFKLPTQHASELKKYKSKEITILASLGEKCTVEPKYYVPASWQKSITKNTDTIFIFLLSETDITYIEIFNLKTKERQNCDCYEIEGEASRAYNHLCKIPTVLVDQYSRMKVIQKEITEYVDEPPYKHNITFKLK